MNFEKIGEDVSTVSLLLYLTLVFIIFSLGDIFNSSFYLYPNTFKVISAIIILLISFLYTPTRKLYSRVLVWSVMKKTSTYFWIVLVYIVLFYVNRLFFKYGFFMDDLLVNNYNGNKIY